MSNKSRFHYRFMRADEAQRLAELICGLQQYQQLDGVTDLPDSKHVRDILCHQNDSGQLVANNKGTFTAFAVDTSKPDEPSKSNIVGYIIYSIKFSLAHGRQFYINSFFIEEPYRRHGLGRKLVHFMQRHGQLLGINRFDVPFMKKNIIGQKFYQTFGAYLVDDQYEMLYVDLKSTGAD